MINQDNVIVTHTMWNYDITQAFGIEVLPVNYNLPDVYIKDRTLFICNIPVYGYDYDALRGRIPVNYVFKMPSYDFSKRSLQTICKITLNTKRPVTESLFYTSEFATEEIKDPYKSYKSLNDLMGTLNACSNYVLFVDEPILMSASYDIY